MAYVKQISLISESRILKGIVSSNENTPIPQGETIVLGLVTSIQSPETENGSTTEGFNFSTVQINKDNDIAQLDMPPYVNFLKGDFNFPSIKEGVKLKHDVMVIVWKTRNGRFGISHSMITNEEIVNSDSVDGASVAPTDAVFSSTDSVDSPAIPVVKKSCRVKAAVVSKNIQVGCIPIFFSF